MLKNQLIDLFSSEHGDEFYKHIKTENILWHKLARNYFNKIYNQYRVFFDEKFARIHKTDRSYRTYCK